MFARHQKSNVADSAKAHRGRLGVHEVLVVIGDRVVAKEGVTTFR